jgi:preprotein translocase subunit YajC
LHIVCPRPVSAAAAEGLLLFSDLINAISTPALRLLAQAVDAAPAAAPAPPFGIGAILNNPLFPLVGLFVLFYFIFIVPERRRKADEAKMMTSLKKNDRIVTIGGIHGTVVAAPSDSDVVTIKIDEGGNTRVKLNRSAISRVVTEGDAKANDSDSGSND